MVGNIFRFVAWLLQVVASKLAITYNEINVIIYYLLIPLSWAIMIDMRLGAAWTTSILLSIWAGIIIGSWGRFRQWSDEAFEWSVKFLNYFNRWGGNYVLNSVIICVFIPILVYVGLIILLINR